MAITQDDFKKIWASTSSVPEYTFSDADYQDGWEFVGNLPPTRAMWDTLQRRNDQKFKFLQDNGSMCFDSVADMVASDLGSGQTVITKGYYSVNDGGSALYTIRAKDVADVDDGGSIIFLDNENVAELITDGTVNVKQFGAKGDGVTSDAVAFQNAVAFAKKLLVPTATYLITQEVILSDIEVDLSNSQILYTIPNYENCFRVGGSNVVIKNGRITPYNQTFHGSGGDHNMPLIVGYYAGSKFNTEIFNVIVENLIVDGGFPQQTGIVLVSRVHNIVLRNIIINGNGNMNIGILLHWGGNDDHSVTYHPHDILIENCKIFNLSDSTADRTGITLSASYNVCVRNITIDTVQNAVGIIPGDYVMENNPDGVYSMFDLQFHNILANNIKRSAFTILGKGNVTSQTLKQYVSIKSCSFKSVLNTQASATYGILFNDYDGNASVIDSTFDNFWLGISFVRGKNVGINGCGFSNIGYNTISLVDAVNVSLINNNMEMNGNAVTTGNVYQIIINTSEKIKISKNLIKYSAIAGVNPFGVRINDETSNKIIISENDFDDFSPAVSIGSASYLERNKVICVNNFCNGAIRIGGGNSIFQAGRKIYLEGYDAPTEGTYQVGDICLRINTAPGNNVGWVCTTAGTPGTWKEFGVVSA